MAANYWTSTQHLHWEDPTTEGTQFSETADGLTSTGSVLDFRLLNVFLQQQVVKLSKRLNARQPVAATAMVFIRRFYGKVDIRSTNPYMVVATSFYLACKIEECPHHIKVVVAEAKTLWQDLIPSDTAKLGQCEFRLVSEINAQLIVHHPYSALKALEKQFALTQDEMNLAWAVINDHYATDLVLRHPPHVIASTAIVLALTTKPNHGASNRGVAGQCATTHIASQVGDGQALQGVLAEALQTKGHRLREWLVESEMDLEAIMNCTQQMISLYVVMEKFSEKECKERLGRLIRSRGLEQWAG